MMRTDLLQLLVKILSEAVHEQTYQVIKREDLLKIVPEVLAALPVLAPLQAYYQQCSGQQALNNLENYINNCLLMEPPQASSEKPLWPEYHSLEKIIALAQQFPQGIVSAEQNCQADFLNHYWQPYIALLEKEWQLCYKNKQKGIDLAKRLPAQKKILYMQQYCQHLTAAWYGADKANISAFYNYYIKMNTAAQISFYDINQLPSQRSQDRYASSIEKSVRRQYINRYKKLIKDKYIHQGGVIEEDTKQIDVLNLNNLMASEECYKLLIQAYLKEWLTTALVASQHALATTAYGPLEDWGQLPSEIKKEIYEAINAVLAKYLHASHIPALFLFLLDELQEQQCPLQYFTPLLGEISVQASHQQAINLLKSVGIAAGYLCAVRRNIMDSLNVHRYLVLSWQRSYALEDIDQQLHDFQLRKQNTHEFSRIRINQMPYQHQHSLSLTSSGYREGVPAMTSFAYDWNEKHDAQAFIHNEVKDIEKLCQDVIAINPQGEESQQLAAEAFYIGMQNPKWDSSIKHTQHIHLYQGSIDNALHFQTAPQQCLWQSTELQYKLLTLGDQQDAVAIAVRFHCRHVSLAAECGSKSVLYLQKQYANQIDFKTYLLPEKNGYYLLLIIPQAEIIKYADSQLLFNADTLSTYCYEEIPEPVVITTAVVSSKDLVAAHGKQALQAFYAFVAKPRVRELLQNGWPGFLATLTGVS